MAWEKVGVVPLSESLPKGPLLSSLYRDGMSTILVIELKNPPLLPRDHAPYHV